MVNPFAKQLRSYCHSYLSNPCNFPIMVHQAKLKQIHKSASLIPSCSYITPVIYKKASQTKRPPETLDLANRSSSLFILVPSSSKLGNKRIMSPNLEATHISIAYLNLTGLLHLSPTGCSELLKHHLVDICLQDSLQMFGRSIQAKNLYKKTLAEHACEVHQS